jgi:general secretion pathway protein L
MTKHPHSPALKIRRGEAVIWLPPRASGERSLAGESHLLVMRRGPRQGGDLRGDHSNPLVSRASLESLPAVRAVHLVFDARDVTILRATVPKLSASRLAKALPGLLEDQVLQDSQQCAWALDPVPLPSGERRIAVIDLGWFETVLQAFERRRIRVLGAWPIQAVMQPEEGASCLIGLPGSLVLALASGDAIGWPAAASGPDRAAQIGSAHALADGLGAPIRHFCAADSQWSVTGAAQPDVLGWPSMTSMDLLAGRRATGWSRQIARVDWRAWRPAAAWTSLAFALALIGLNLEWARLAGEERRLSAVVRSEFAAVLGPGTPVVDPVLQLSRHVTALRARAGKPDPDGFIGLLGRLVDALGNYASDALLAVQYRDGQMSVRFRPALTQTPAARDRLIDACRLQGLELAFEAARDGLAIVRPLR